MTLPVFYWSWQYECCGGPCRVGDQVAWPLKVSFGGEPWMPADWTVEAELQRHPTANGNAVRVDQLVAHTEQPLCEAKRERVIFYEEHHGEIPERFPATTGLVSRIRVASVVFRDGQALPGTAALRDVNVVPEVFHVESGHEYRSEVGVLVDLEPTATAAS